MNEERKAEIIAIREQLKARREAHEKYQKILEATLKEYGLPMQIAQVVKNINHNWRDNVPEPYSAYDAESGGVGGYTYALIQQNIRFLDKLLTQHNLNLEYYLEDGKPKGVRIAEISELLS